MNNDKTKILDGMVCGNIPIKKPLNLKTEIKNFKGNPLNPLIEYLNESLVVHGDIGQYYRAFDYYFLSLERVLSHISIGSRFQRQVRPYHGGGRKFSKHQNAILHQYRSQRKFFELDFTSYLLHARILLDRTICISRRFIQGERLPSFSSFSKHKKFLKNKPGELKVLYPEYCEKIVKSTDWFEMPIKAVRDKIHVHNPPKHFLFLVYNDYHDLQMQFILQRKHESFGDAMIVRYSVRRIALDIKNFLVWYNSYVYEAIQKMNK